MRWLLVNLSQDFVLSSKRESQTFDEVLHAKIEM